MVLVVLLVVVVSHLFKSVVSCSSRNGIPDHSVVGGVGGGVVLLSHLFRSVVSCCSRNVIHDNSDNFTTEASL